MNKKILLIDDEDSIIFAFKRVLEGEGYDISSSASFQDAIEKINKCGYDLIFSDIRLNGNTGIDLLREVKKRGLSTPVIIMTGYPDVASASKAVYLGAFDYLVKPIKRETIIRHVKMALSHKELCDEKERCQINLDAIFRNVKDGILTIDTDLNVLGVNKAAEDICDILTKENIGGSFKQLSGGCNAQCLAIINKTLETKDYNELYRVECRSRRGRRRIVDLSSFPLIDMQDRFYGCGLVIRDETRIVKLESDLHARAKFYKLIGKCENMQKVYTLIENLANVNTTVLITGESGTGKELVADALHNHGDRSDKPFVKVNCAALPNDILESELFGHVKGAFTGAVSDRVGRFQMAAGGTIFLDEIGEVSYKMQLRLLRVLQEKEFERVGDSVPIKVDVRVIAATNKILSEQVRLGKFREDLFHRLSVVEVDIPPLRERQDDIPFLVSHFLEKFNKKFDKLIKGVSTDVQHAFVNYAWSGNVREMEHTIEHAFVLCKDTVVTLDDLPQKFKGLKDNIGNTKIDMNDEIDEINRALEKCGGNKSKAARLLGIDRKTLYRKLERYGIQTDNLPE